MAATREANLRESFVQMFEILVRMAKQHIRPYLPSLFGLARSIWPDCLTQLLKLIETVAEVKGVVTVCALRYLRAVRWLHGCV